MAELNETGLMGLAAYYEMCGQLHKWVDPLSNEQFWRKPYRTEMHGTGVAPDRQFELLHWCARRGTGYVETANGSYGQTAPSKEEALRALDRTIAMVMTTIRKQGGDWERRHCRARAGATNRMQFRALCGHAYIIRPCVT